MNNNYKNPYTVALSIAVLTLTLTAQAAVPKNSKMMVSLDQGKGDVTFLAVGRPSALKINGKGPAPKGSFAVENSKQNPKLSGKIQFSLDALETGIAMRDRHMKEKYLETGKFPVAELDLKNIALPQSLPDGDFTLENIAFEAPLTLHGTTRNVNGRAKIARAGGHMIVNAEFGLKISDYAISLPSFAGITVADEVKINVNTESPMVVQ